MAPQPPRRRIVGVSTKMYFSAARTQTFVSSFLRHLAQSSSSPALSQLDIFIVPDFITLASVVAQTREHATPRVLVGAQDCHAADAGAYTGEVSPAVLAEVGARLVELGHAERRNLFGETDGDVAAKAAAVVRNGMVPLVCVGEVERGGDDGGDIVAAAAAEVGAQVDAVLAAVPGEADVVLAYEPVWAIGAAQPAAASHVVAVVAALRERESLRAREGLVRILYGGSAGPGLFKEMKGAVDGLFLGRFAHDPEHFYRTVCEVAEV